MKTISTTGSKGNEYGHVPGHNYHDVEVTITRRLSGRWCVAIIETQGSAQAGGFDEEHERKTVIGRGSNLAQAVRDAREKANDAKIHKEYLVQAISEAEVNAEEAEAAAETFLADGMTAARQKALQLRGTDKFQNQNLQVSNTCQHATMLRAPTFKERPQFERFPNGTSTWFGEPCRVISVVGEGTSYASICLIHESHAQNAFHYLDSGVNLARIYEAKILPGMDEFQSHFLCIGLYLQGKLVGFWDMPLNWMEGAKLLSWADLQSPEFQALWNAAKNYAATHPEGTWQNTFKAMP